MKITILARSAFTSILRNKTRSVLTTLGVVIGVLSVILLTSIGNGLTVFVEQEFQGLGSNLLIVTPGEIVSSEGGFSGQETALSFANSKLTVADSRALELAGYPITASVPLAGGSGEARTAAGKRSGMIVGTTPGYSVARNTKTTKGRFLSESDISSSRKVVVIGSKIADKLFPDGNPVGQSITINSLRFEVVGVAETKAAGSFGGPDIDSFMYIPITTAKSAVGIDKIMEIMVQSSSKDQLDRTKALITTTLTKRLESKDFAVTDQSEILKTIQTILGTLTIGLAGIAAISLVVGGIGIMNIMLVAVSERTREIGLRKALGATPNNIMLQFLIESAVLSTIGGVIGIALGILGTLAIRPFFPATPALNSVLLAFGVSLATGIIFGVFPARKAAKLNPIDALRYE
jgi:putative ABC transport system permease protein